jgi:hypothetical protein
MKIKMQAKGFDQLFLQLSHAADRVKDGARKQLHRAGNAVEREARLNAPVDEHNLEQSIKKQIDYGFRGRLQIQVVMGGFVNGVNVDEYAVEIHENYESRSPGPGTIAKREANPGRYVGGKFLERALEENRDKIERGMFTAVMKEWRL